MTGTNERLRSVLVSLWLRLNSVGAIAALFAAAAGLPQMVAPWRYDQSTGEIIFGVAVRIIVAALAGVALGTIGTAAATPLLLIYPSSRDRLVKQVTKIAVSVAAYLCLSIPVKMLVNALLTLTGLHSFPTMAVYSAAFTAVLCIPRRRNQIATSLDGFLEEKTTRRAAIATGIASAGLVVAEWTMSKGESPAILPARASRRPGPNVLFVTFDALAAEDMSLYGYRLPTTPNIDEFSRKSSVFTNFYSASTFTTASIATLLTGLYPSEHRVYNLPGRLSADYEGKTVPHLMRAAGYATGASVGNPWAYFLSEVLAPDYNDLEGPVSADFDLWRATGLLHQHQPYGSRGREFWDMISVVDPMSAFVQNAFGRNTSGENTRPRAFVESKFPPAASFAQARKVVDGLPDGFFMWVHILSPHAPYLPSAPWLGRFLPPGEMMTGRDQSNIQLSEAYSKVSGLRCPGCANPADYYKPEWQPLVDKARLRYDEFIQESDSAFGSFISGLEGAGRLDNTAVIVAADHGESFEGGLYMHFGEVQTRPEIHIPLVVRMPGQEQGRRIGMTMDQTVLAPTILDIAGVPRPDWMRGQSLLPWLKHDLGGVGGGLAFTQHLAGNSMFRPLSSGTVGVIDGQHQYVLNLQTGASMLRSLAEANLCDLDRSNENPALAQSLREVIYSRFPDFRREST